MIRFIPCGKRDCVFTISVVVDRLRSIPDPCVV